MEEIKALIGENRKLASTFGTAVIISLLIVGVAVVALGFFVHDLNSLEAKRNQIVTQIERGQTHTNCEAEVDRLFRTDITTLIQAVVVRDDVLIYRTAVQLQHLPVCAPIVPTKADP